MIDTGAAPNVIKKRSLHSDVFINHDDPLLLSGITSGRVETLGSVEILIMGYPVTLYVVPDNFPIAQEGILGSDFLRDASNINLVERHLEWHGSKIPFSSRETMVVPARSQSTFYLRINNPHIKVGYVPRLHVCDGVYLGDAVVTNRDGKAYVRVINTGEEDRELIVPSIELQEIDLVSTICPESDKPEAAVNIIQLDKTQRPKQIQQLLRLEHLNDDELRHVNDLLHKHSDLFQLPDESLGFTNSIEHKIITTDDSPINVKQYRFPPAHKQEINKQVGDMLEKGVIEASTSPYNSPLWVVPKKPDSKGNKRWRLVIDFRGLNEKTLGDAYPLPNITDILDQLGSAKYFSVFDLASGFHQIPMAVNDAAKTAFSTPYGHYEFKRMPFGLRNAPATFQRLMDRVLSGLQGIELFVYLDDIVIYSSSLTEHARKFNKLAERLRAANLRLQPDKCEFLRKEVTYLGHVIGEAGVKPDPNKIKAVKSFPRPKNAKNVKQFLGLAGYYRRFINNFSKAAKPLTSLLKKDEPFLWQEAQENAFTELRDQLCTEPLLQHPDFTRPFLLTTDASGYAIGGILSQGEIGKDRPIAYASRLLNGAEQNYSTIEKESLAIIYCVNHFRPYLYGNQFIILTDHKPLEWLHSVKDPTSRLIRWRLKLAEYDYKVMYKAGKMNCNADALSRNPIEPWAPASRDIAQAFPLKLCDSDNRNPPKSTPLEPSSSSDENLFDAASPRQAPDKGAPDATADINRPTKSVPNKVLRNSPPDASKPDHLSDSDETIPDAPNELNSNKRVKFETTRGNLPTRQEVAKTTTEKSLSPDKQREPLVNPILPGSDVSTSDSETDSDSESSDGSIIFDTPNEPYIFNPENRIKFNSTRDNLSTRRDNLVVFITRTGEPCDKGAQALAEAGILPRIADATLARARPTPHKGKNVITLTVKDRVSNLIEREILNEAIHSLLDVVRELDLQTLSICNGDVGSVPWESVRKQISNTLANTGVTITVCRNEVTIPPIDIRETILQENHASAIGGHKGVSKTYRRIRDKYYWPRMKNDIQAYIQRCRNCQLKKLVRRKTKQPMVLTDTPDAAFDKVSMDIMGPLPTSHDGKSYILTIQDLLTKYSLAIPLERAGAIDVADAFVNDFISIYGAPKALLTDQGSHFINSLMKAIAKRFKISKYTTTAYRPQSNGSVERSHHVLWEYLKQVTTDKRDWSSHLKLACFSYNTSVHEGTQYTPHELVFGKVARTPTCEVLPEDISNESYAEYLTNLYNKLRDMQETARGNLERAKLRAKRYYDKKMNPCSFKVGDEAYLLKEPTHKLGDQYTGPYKIIEILRNNNVKLRISGKLARTVHTDKLKPAPTRNQHLENSTPRPSEDAADSSTSDDTQ
jgi:transposase InsO family protein